MPIAGYIKAGTIAWNALILARGNVRIAKSVATRSAAAVVPDQPNFFSLGRATERNRTPGLYPAVEASGDA
jgi:hypothetical protein